VNAEAPDVLLTSLGRVASAVGVADPDGDSAESARRQRDHLETRPGPGLMVFDNAAGTDLLSPFLPASGSAQIVLTSTDRAFADWGVRVDVAVFTRPESTVYLAERTGLDDPDGAEAVAREPLTASNSSSQRSGTDRVNRSVNRSVNRTRRAG